MKILYTILFSPLLVTYPTEIIFWLTIFILSLPN